FVLITVMVFFSFIRLPFRACVRPCQGVERLKKELFSLKKPSYIFIFHRKIGINIAFSSMLAKRKGLN
ncbi:hypothetical protein N9K58_05430, partial [Alphaproteobacteria bacterium]|nr:hypothetical protein [Alphaproteobacteria bacterium]